MNCSKKFLFHHHRHILRGLCSKVKKPLASKFDFDLDENTRKAIEARLVNARYHPGKQTVKTVELPSELLEAVSHVLSDYPTNSIESGGVQLSKHIWSRHLPLEGIEYEDKLRDVTEKVIRQEKLDPMSPEITDEERKRLLDFRNSKIKRRMKSELYNWKPISYNDYNSASYLASRVCPDYAALVKVLTEIKKRDGQFSPVTMIDFGSGVGTGMWAMDSIWPQSCKEVVCIDASAEMNNLADKLLRGGKITDERRIRPGGTFFKQFLPMSDVLKYDLVLASRSLFELPNMESRLRTLDILWRKTAGYLVVIEAGTNAGYKAVLEARDYILQLGRDAEEQPNTLEGHVFAPCPHEKFWKMLRKNLNKTATILEILKDLHYDKPENFSLLRYQKVLIHLIGVLKLQNSLSQQYVIELVDLLMETNLTDSEQWLDILTETDCEVSIIEKVTEVISKNNHLYIKDGNLRAAACVLQTSEFEYVNINIFSDPGKMKFIKPVLKALSASKTRIHLSLLHHWHYPEQGWSDDFLRCLLGKNKPKLTHFKGSVKSLSSLSNEIDVLFVALGTHYAKHADRTPDFICKSLANIEQLYIHVTGGIDVDCLPDLPKKYFHVDLWFSEIDDTLVDWVGSAVEKLSFKFRPFWSIRFPRSTLTADGCIKLAKILKGKALFGKDGIIISSEHIPQDEIKRLKEVFLSEIRCSCRLLDGVRVWSLLP